MSNGIIKGYFWDPEKEDLKNYGELTVSNENDSYKLTIHGVLHSFNIAILNINFHKAIAFIHGYTENNEYVTLRELRVLWFENLKIDDNYKDLHHKSTTVTLSVKHIIYNTNSCIYPNNDYKINSISFVPQFLNSLIDEFSFECQLNENFINNNKDNEREVDTISYLLKKSTPLSIPFKQGKAVFKGSYSSIPFREKTKLEINRSYCFQIDFYEAILFDDLPDYVHQLRAFFILLTGTYISLDNISFFINDNLFIFNSCLNKSNIHYSTNYPNPIVNLRELSSSEYLNNFFSVFNSIKLPLNYYLTFIESERKNPHQELLLLLSAIEIIFNKTYKIAEGQTGEILKVAAEILAIKELTKHQRDFLMTFKKGNKIREFKIKDKLLKLITDSPKLTELTREPEAFVEKVTRTRHYLVHESNYENLELYNDQIILRKYNMKLKIILEYYLLKYIDVPMIIVEERISKTLNNVIQFRYV